MLSVYSPVLGLLRMFDSTGSLVRISSMDNNQIDLDISDLPAGFYFLHLVSENGLHTGKLIVR